MLVVYELQDLRLMRRLELAPEAGESRRDPLFYHRAGPKAVAAGPKRTPLGYLSGPISLALGPALKGSRLVWKTFQKRESVVSVTMDIPLCRHSNVRFTSTSFPLLPRCCYLCSLLYSLLLESLGKSTRLHDKVMVCGRPL